jgi:hypothetical protein
MEYFAKQTIKRRLKDCPVEAKPQRCWNALLEIFFGARHMKYYRCGFWMTPKEWLIYNSTIFSAILWRLVINFGVIKKFPFFYLILKLLDKQYQSRFEISRILFWSKMTREEGDRLEADWEQGERIVVNAQGLVTHIPASSHRDCLENKDDKPTFHNP